MTKYPLTCRRCDFEYEKDQPPPEGAKQDDPDGIAPNGILDTEFVNSAVCPNCGETGATSGWRGFKPNEP